MNRSPSARRAPRALGGLAIVIALAGCGTSAADDVSGNTDKLQVGLFQVASAPVLDDIVDGFRQALLADSGFGAGDVEFVERNAQGDPGLIQSIARDLAERDLDLIAVVGTPAVLAQAQAETRTPIVALAMGDPVLGGVAESLDAPGANVTGSIDYVDPARVLDQVLAVQPAVRRIGTVFDPSNDNMRVWMHDLRAAATRQGLQLVEAAISGAADLAGAARSLGGRVDAVLTGPDTTVIGGIDAVAQFAADERLGLYGIGLDAATAGVLAVIGPDYREVGALAGQAAAEVLAGADPATVAFRRPGDVELVVNRAGLRRLDLTLAPEVAGRAEMTED